MSESSPETSRRLAYGGAGVLFAGAAIHVLAGFPALSRGIDAGLIARAPGMSPTELKAVWIAGAILMVALGLAPLLAWRSADVFRRLTLLSAVAALGCAVTIAGFTGGAHPASMFFGIAAALFAGAHWRS
jgi:hypothetical protein